MSVSVFVQTLNEERNLSRCLETLRRLSDDIVVLDSFSSDGTEKVAHSFGARWFQHEFTGRAAHQNWAMENIDWKYPWVYYSDADEVVPAELAEEIRSVTANGTPHVAYRVRRRDHFMGKWIKRSSQYPIYFVRLFKPSNIRWSRRANPVPHIDGTVGTLVHDYIHYPFSKGLEDWVTRHNRYSSFEAEESLEAMRRPTFRPWNVLTLDATRRRYVLKELSIRLPLRHRCRFVYMYLLRGGFLDGYPGLVYCRLVSFYEYLIMLKMRERRRLGAGHGS